MATVPQTIPLSISIAPFPEGFQGDMDETFQQAVQNMEAFIQGNFLTGLILPPNSTLPTTDQGPIAMGEQWYFWDAATSQYLPQTVSVKTAKNFAKNCVYQVAQAGTSFTPAVGITQTFDLALCRVTEPNIIAISVDVGPVASGDNDPIPSAIAFTVGPSLLPTPVATDLFTHEHCFEGSDIAALQGQTLSLSFSVWGNQPGVYSAYLTSAGRDVSYVVPFQILVANQWTRIKIPGIPPLPTGLGTWNFAQGVTGLYFGVPMVVGTQWQTANPNHWVAQFVAGTSGNINLLTVANNQLKITGIKLEASSSVSYLSCPTFDSDYWDAIRYYFTTFDIGNPVVTPILGHAPIDGEWMFSQLWPHRMCRAPVCIPFSYASGQAGFFADLSLGIDILKATMVGTPKGLDDSGFPSLTPTGNIGLIETGTIGGITGLVGTLTAGSAVITLTTGNTNSLTPGMPVTGTGIPAGAKVFFLNSTTVFTITAAVPAAGTGVALTFGTIHITALASTTGLSVGAPVSGTGIPAGATIAAIVSGTAVDLSVPATPGTSISLNLGSIHITGIADTSGMAAGQVISGAGIPANDTIATVVSPTAIDLVTPATAGAAVALTVLQVKKGDTLAAYFTADARLT